SPSYGTMVGKWDAPKQARPDEFHHFGWNICSSALSADHVHTGGGDGSFPGAMNRRYLLIPGLKSSRMYILDVGPDPTQPELVKTIEPEDLIGKSGYRRPHTIHC